jgi:hypothetical protein
MRTATSFRVLITAVVVNVSCRGVLGPSYTDESGGVLRTEASCRWTGRAATPLFRVPPRRHSSGVIADSGACRCGLGDSLARIRPAKPNPRCRRGERRSGKLRLAPPS